MRIVCQKCAAAYAIDDRVITPKGVRAQCPRCRHLQLVKREDAPAQPAAPAPAATAPAPKPAAAPKPAVAPKPAAATARPAPTTPSGSLSDSLFGDLGDMEPAPDPDAGADSLLGDLAAIGKAPAAAPALSKDSLFGDLAELTQSSPSNPIPSGSSGDPLFDNIDLSASSPAQDRPATPGYSLPSGDLLFDDIAPPPPAPAPVPKPVQAKPAAPAQPKPAAPAFPASSDDALFDFNSPPGFDAPPPAAPAPQPKPAAPPVQAKPAPAPFPEPADDGLFDFNAPPGFAMPPQAAAPAPQPKPAAPPVQAKPAAPAPQPKPAAPPVQAKPAPAPFPEPADDGLFDFNSPPGFDAPPQPAAPAPTPAAPEGDPLLDFFGAPTSQPAPAPAPVKAPAPAPAAAPSFSAAPKACRECGKSLVDPFDQALGACEDCRQRAKPASAPPPAARSVEVLDLPPMGNGASGPTSVPSEPDSGARSAGTPPTLAAEPRSGVRPAGQRSVTSTGVAVSASSGRGRGALIGAVVLLLVVAGAGSAYVFVPQVKELVGNSLGGGGGGGGGGETTTPSNQPAAATLPPALESVLPRWQLMFVDAGSGDSKQLLSEGQSLLAKDQRLAYTQAAESFQRALLLDPKSDAAIGGYVQALALGQGSRMDEATFQEARSLIEAAEGRSRRDADVLVAHANLLLARSGQAENVDQARKLAEEVLSSPKDATAPKAEAHLVLGRVFLTSSRELANQHFDSALAIASDLQRVHYYRALADETAGDFSQAIDRLEKRLAQDADHWETRTTLARIFLEVGEVERARQLYETRLKSSPGDFQALLSLAVLRYQVEGGLPGALGALRGMLRNREKYEDREVADLLVHMAAVERSANNLDAAAKAARESLELVKDNPAAQLQLFLVALARKDAAAAAGHLATLRGHLETPELEKLLEGRLRLLERKPAEAMERFMEVARMDPRRADALLLAGVAAAQEGRRDDAFRALAQAIQGDPLRLAPRPVVTSFYLRSGDLLEGLEGSIVGIARDENDILPHLYEGLLRFHQGNAAAAEKMLKQVNEVDSTYAPASAYRAFISLGLLGGRKDLKAAAGHAGRAVAGGRQVAIAHLAQGLVLVEAKQVEPAKRAFREAVTLAPKLYSAEVRLAELEAATSRDSVRTRLVRLLGLDPSYLPAKRVLYMLDKRG